MGFHWSLSDSKSPQVSRTRLWILTVLSNAVIWIVSTRPPTSNSPRPFNNPLVIVPNASIKIGTIVTIMFHSFFSSLARSRDLSFFAHSFRFILWSHWMETHRTTKVKVRSPDGDTEYFDIVAGVLQRDTLAPYLFIICLDYVLRTSVDKIRENSFELIKKAEGTTQKQLLMPTTPMT